MKLRSVTLYRSEAPPLFWMTDVSLRENGDIAFCSGDNSREWYVIVRAAHVQSLQETLREDEAMPPDGMGGSEVLDLVSRRFGTDSGENPFEAIKLFLTERRIPWKDDVW